MKQETKEALRKLVFSYWADFFKNVSESYVSESPLVRAYAELNLAKFVSQNWHEVEGAKKSFFRNAGANILDKFHENGFEKNIAQADFAKRLYELVTEFCADIMIMSKERKALLNKKLFEGYDNLTSGDIQTLDKYLEKLIA